jgi:hypothetical protein
MLFTIIRNSKIKSQYVRWRSHAVNSKTNFRFKRKNNSLRLIITRWTLNRVVSRIFHSQRIVNLHHCLIYFNNQHVRCFRNCSFRVRKWSKWFITIVCFLLTRIYAQLLSFRSFFRSFANITTNIINIQTKNNSRKRMRLILRLFVKRSRFTLRSSQSQNELKRLQTKLQRLKKNYDNCKQLNKFSHLMWNLHSKNYELRKKIREKIFMICKKNKTICRRIQMIREHMLSKKKFEFCKICHVFRKKDRIFATTKCSRTRDKFCIASSRIRNEFCIAKTKSSFAKLRIYLTKFATKS